MAWREFRRTWLASHTSAEALAKRCIFATGLPQGDAYLAARSGTVRARRYLMLVEHWNWFSTGLPGSRTALSVHTCSPTTHACRRRCERMHICEWSSAVGLCRQAPRLAYSDSVYLHLASNDWPEAVFGVLSMEREGVFCPRVYPEAFSHCKG